MREGRPSRTAEATALMRAVENRRPDPILRDPYAESFLSLPVRIARRWTVSYPLANAVCARHAFLDDVVRVAAREGRLEQLVLLGAGYDTRAWRLAEALGGAPVFEVDFPATGERKARKAAALPPTNVVRVPIDFKRDAVDERLLAAGFDPGRRSVFLWEGVSMYLSEEAVRGTLGTVHRLGGDLAMDLYHAVPDRLLLRASSFLPAIVGEPVTWDLPPAEAPAFFRSCGFGVVDLAEGRELARRYVRDGRRVADALYVVDARRR